MISNAGITLAVSVLVWWIANTVTSITSKRVMKAGWGDLHPNAIHGFTASFLDLRWIELTSIQHLLGMFLALIWLKLIMRKPVWPQQGGQTNKKLVYIAAVANLLGNLGTNAAYSSVSSGATQVIRACEPITTFVLSFLLLKHHERQVTSTLCALVILITGATTFVVLDTSFNIWGLLAGICSSIAFPVLNIFLKKFTDTWESPLQKYTVISIYSTVLVLPLLCMKLLLTQDMIFTIAPSDSIFSAISHFTSNVASISVLQSVTPLTHAVFNLSKRILVIIVNILYFHIHLSFDMSVGLIVFSIGLFLYHFRNSLSQRVVKCTSILVAIVFCLYYQAHVRHVPLLPKSIARTTILRKLLPSPTNINMAWSYDHPVPSNVLKNVEELHNLYPKSHIHMYCGTTQCVHSITNMNKSKITAEFLVVPNLVKGMILEGWLARHPLHKVLTGLEYEQHLQEVVRLGILWHHGGLYIDPTLKINEAFSVPTEDTPWLGVSEYEHSSSRPLDIAFFPKRHLFIHTLAEYFVRNYPEIVMLHNQAFNFEDVFQNAYSEYCMLREETCPKKLTLSLEKLDVYSSSLDSEISHFGTLSYGTRVHYAGEANLGDEVQGFPGIQFLPYLDHFLDRDALSKSEGQNTITAFFNAWWGSPNADWPPPKNINPVMVSIHIGKQMQQSWTNHIEYLISKAPIGCRDQGTLELLQKHHVNSYFSGCMTLLLKNPNIGGQRTDNIFLVDVKEELIKLLPQVIRDEAIRIEHSLTGSVKNNDGIQRFTEAYKLIEMYASAKVVITQRIHCALPCVAMGTPVVFIESSVLPGGGGSRTAGLTPLFHTLYLSSNSVNEAKRWLHEFSWNDPPPNPNINMMMRLRATAWNAIRNYPSLHDAGHKFGLVPLSPPGAKGSLTREKPELIFHLFYNGSGDKSHGLSSQMFTVESIFHHHPFARVLIHSNTVKIEEFHVLLEAGYNIEVLSYNLNDMLKDTPAEGLAKGHNKLPLNNCLYQVLALYKWGGVYMDTEMILVKPLDILTVNSVVQYTAAMGNTGCNAFMFFEKHNLSLEFYLKEYISNVNNNNSFTKYWATDFHAQTSTVKNGITAPSDVHTLSVSTVYVFNSHNKVHHCFDTTQQSNSLDAILRNKEIFLVHMNLSVAEIDVDQLKEGSICRHLMNVYCVLCNKQHFS